ncbi:MAG: tRNA lysidine(34) synthetase TilS [Thermoleophilaceae bacterium]
MTRRDGEAGGGEPVLARARATGLVRAGEPLLVMLSGGADSVCLLDVAIGLGADVSVLHVNYGLRPGAAADEELCQALCARLSVALAVEVVRLSGTGNLQAEARDARYAAAERLTGPGAELYATGHTLSDQAETVLYRLATSPGRRALLGMAPRRGRLVRPLLEVEREETRAHCEARGLPWREDPSNEDPRFARTRVRHEVMPVLRALAPSAVRTIAETARTLREEAEVLDAAVDEALGGAAVRAVSIAALRERGPALARLALRRLAEAASDGARSLSSAQARAVLELGSTTPGGSASLDLGGGLRALVEYGTVRFTRATDPSAPDAVELEVPGTARFGSWELEARLVSREEALAGAGRDDAVLDAAALGPAVIVRAWRAGDRMRPAGLGGTKTLQDLFTDAKVPRALRASLPLVEAGEEIACVAGLAVGEAFRLRESSRVAVLLSARRPPAFSGAAPTLAPDA